MLSSSFDYFKALQEGNYLLFLEWPAFIEQKYTGKGESLGTDSLIDCLVFEWLAQGFCKDHIDKIVILSAVYELEPSPLEAGKYAFPLMLITTAVFSCMLFCRHHIEEIRFPKTKVSAIEAIKLIEERLITVDKKVYDESMRLVRHQFTHQITFVDKALVMSVCKKINLIIELISILEKYTLTLNLQKDQETDNSLYGTRLGLVQRFLAYMREQTELNEEVSGQIALYVTAIRRQAPAVWEELYLKKLAPPTFIEKSWSVLAYTGMGFFDFITSGATPQTDIEPQSTGSEGPH